LQLRTHVAQKKGKAYRLACLDGVGSGCNGNRVRRREFVLRNGELTSFHESRCW
jgi:hypothetical protein